MANSEDGSGVFSLRPDIVIKKGAEVAIVDTKYKLLDDEDRKYGVSQADMYQMYAYVTKKDAVSSMLLYPDTELRESRTFYYNLENDGKRSVPLYITSIKLSSDLQVKKDGLSLKKISKMLLYTFFPV